VSNSPEPARTRRTLSTTRVVFIVIAAAAPMAAMVGVLPLAIIRGNGVGIPSAYLLGALVLVCFVIGYSAMTKRVVGNGAFYVFVAKALGKPLGLATGYVATLGYAGLSIGLTASFGYFTHVVLEGLGVELPWYLFSAVAIAVVGVLGYRSAELSARVLAILMALEFAVLIVLDVLVVAHDGAAAVPVQSFTPSYVFVGSFGVAVMFALTSFVGFESGALYGEETKEPARSIPKAIYISVGVIAVFYVITSWIIVGAAGGLLAPVAAKSQTGELVIDLANRYGGELLLDATAVLLCTSLLASCLALHNAASRYLFALGRENVLPPRLGDYHPRHLSPHVGSIVMSALTIVVIGAFVASGADPYTVAASSLVGLGTIAIIAVQAIAALAVLVFFWRRNDRTLWRTVIAPAVGFLGLGSAFVLAALNYSALTGTENRVVNLVPLILVIVAVAGIIVMMRLHSSRPAVYATFAEAALRRRTGIELQKVEYSRRYCVVGGGPASMVMARALVKEGIPFDWFERNSDFGGIWEIDAPGSPMYQSAHFISSKYTSGFFGKPMPDDFPDYPAWRQIREYIREFGRDFDLYGHVTFDTSVDGAELIDGDRWRVTLSDGETREYDGLICAPGVTWFPSAPSLPGEEGFTGEVRHSVTFRDGLELRGKRVLIVGAGNSGVDIASDAARHADAAFLSVRRGYRYVPKHIGGLPTDAVLAGILDPPRGMSLSGNTNQLLDSLVGDLTRLGLPAPDHDALASHPIMNNQVLHHLAHGDLVAKPDVERLDGDEVVFTDGSRERIDVVLLATGYEYRVPFVDPSLFVWKSGHPQLYLNVFSREVDSLYVLGFIEFADAAYKRFDEMAQLVIMDIRARETGLHREELVALKATDQPDLRGGIQYIDSPRHANYVESHAYQSYLAQLRDRFDWPDIDDSTYRAG
jgi:amino acid transporter